MKTPDTEPGLIDQKDLIEIFRASAKGFAWFLGAGTSRNSGLPTAGDIIWDLKKRYYCREENQDISEQDTQNDAVKQRIQSFMDARGFPPLWANEEYSSYFEKIFGSDRERQRKYLRAILSEDKVSLSVGNRILAALIASDLCRVCFTTNFDTVVEKAVAEVSGQSLAAFHLEGSHAASQALNAEEYPIYCKLHGDFRYDSIKNLSEDLLHQNEQLSKCFINAGNRFGFIVAGYSGRDNSVMKLFHQILASTNPFPHGLFWTGIKGSQIPPAVSELLEHATTKGVLAEYVEIETFDALMLRLWRNLPNRPQKFDAKVKKSGATKVSIPIPNAGKGKPIIRFNALPLVSLPKQCLQLSFKTPKQWNELRETQRSIATELILTKADTVFCWGIESEIQEAFQDDLVAVRPIDLPVEIESAANLHIKGFLLEALCLALKRDRPLLARTKRNSAYLIVDSHATDVASLEPLFHTIGKTSGIIPGLFAAPTEDEPEPRQVSWAECLRLSIDKKFDQVWLLVEPDIWIWPAGSRPVAADFLDQRRASRFNKKFNELIK